MKESKGGLIYLQDESGWETDQELVSYFNAGPDAVQQVISAPLDDDGRSEWTWFRTINGDLILGIFPRGDTYFNVEGLVERDYIAAEADIEQCKPRKKVSA